MPLQQSLLASGLFGRTLCLALVLICKAAIAEEQSAVSGQTPAKTHEKKSDIAFRELFNTVSAEPTKRDYAAVLGPMRAICDSYPGSDAAQKIILTVAKWKAKGWVEGVAWEAFEDYAEKYNPAKARLDELQKAAASAAEKSDLGNLRKIGGELEEIAARHPGTLSEFIAMANLAPLYHRCGDRRKSLEASTLFLKKYDTTTTDFPAADNYMFSNLTINADLIAKSESLDAGIAAYERMAEINPSNGVFTVPALYEAGELSMRQGQYDRAIEFFERLASFPHEFDNRCILAKFRIIECHIHKDEKAAAAVLAAKLVNTKLDAHWAGQAENLLRWCETGGGTSTIEPVPDPAAQAKGEPRSAFGTVVFWNLAAVTTGLVCLALYRLRRKWRRLSVSKV